MSSAVGHVCTPTNVGMQNGLVMRHAHTLCMEDVICWIDSLEDLFLE
jgi:hypothetical protein